MYPDATPTVAVTIGCHSHLDPCDQAAARPLCRGRAVGYSRVPPTQPGGVRRTVLGLQAAGVDSEHINIDNTPLNGARPFLAHTLTRLSSGDRLLVPSLSHLARSASELARILNLLNQKEVELWVAGERFSELTPTQLIELIAAMTAEFKAEAEAADKQYLDKAAPDRRGYTRALTSVESLEVRETFDAGGTSVRTLAHHFGVSKATVYRAAGPLLLPR